MHTEVMDKSNFRKSGMLLLIYNTTSRRQETHWGD